jgi:CheY-like chemotaxis protein
MGCRRYLVIDDNRPLAENLAEIIEGRGDAVVEVVHSGQDALVRLGRVAFDAAVTDMRMPGLAGAALVQAMRSLDLQLPIVLLTAYSSDAELEQARGHGILGVLPKPVPIDALLALLAGASRAATRG